MAGFRVEACKETEEMYLLTYRMIGMYTGLLKTRLFFRNRKIDSDLNFTEFFEATYKVCSLCSLISHNFQRTVPAIEQAPIGQKPAVGSKILEDAGYSIFLGFGFICCLVETAFMHVLQQQS